MLRSVWPILGNESVFQEYMKGDHTRSFNREEPLLQSAFSSITASLRDRTSISHCGLSLNDGDRGQLACFLCLRLIMSIKAKTMSFKSKKMQNMEIKVELILKIKWVRN